MHTHTIVLCSCSICVKKQNKHFIVPKSHFSLIQVSYIMFFHCAYLPIHFIRVLINWLPIPSIRTKLNTPFVRFVAYRVSTHQDQTLMGMALLHTAWTKGQSLKWRLKNMMVKTGNKQWPKTHPLQRGQN